jgi:hypothetical protein
MQLEPSFSPEPLRRPDENETQSSSHESNGQAPLDKTPRKIPYRPVTSVTTKSLAKKPRNASQNQESGTTPSNSKLTPRAPYPGKSMPSPNSSKKN